MASPDNIEALLGPVYAAAELALEAKRFAEDCRRRGAPEELLDQVTELAFRALQQLQHRVAELDQAVLGDRNPMRPPPHGGPALN
jgi:hypothetical protein